MKTESRNLNCSCQRKQLQSTHPFTHTVQLQFKDKLTSRRNVCMKYLRNFVSKLFLHITNKQKKQNCIWQHIAYLFSHKNLAFMHKSNEMWYNMIIAFCWCAHIRPFFIFYDVIVCLLSNIKTWQQNSYVKLSYEYISLMGRWENLEERFQN